MSYSVVVPTIGRASLARLVSGIECHNTVSHSREIIVVDDRASGCGRALQVPDVGVPVRVLRTGGRGPAAARNAAITNREIEKKSIEKINTIVSNYNKDE